MDPRDFAALYGKTAKEIKKQPALMRHAAGKEVAAKGELIGRTGEIPVIHKTENAKEDMPEAKEVRKKRRPVTPRPGLVRYTLVWIYKNLYILGITLLRRKLVFDRKRRYWRSRTRQAYFNRLDRVLIHIKRYLINLRTRVRTPIMLIRRTYRDVLPDIRSKREKGKIPFKEYLAVLEPVARLIFKIISTIFNYTAPVAAAIFFVYVVNLRISEPIILAVSYNGEVIGHVQNESVFSAATQDVQSRLTTDGESAFNISLPNFELMSKSEFENRKRHGEIPADADALNGEQLADKLIRASGDDVSEAFGLYINDRFLGAVTEKEPVLNTFMQLLNDNRTYKPDEELRFSKSIRFRPGLYPKQSLTDQENVLSILTSFDTVEETYTVRAGDSPSGIADRIGVPLIVLRELNPDMDDKMFEGEELLTNVAKPFLPVENTFTDIVEEPIDFETIEVENMQYARGYSEVFQEGEEGVRRVTYRVTSENGLEKHRTEVGYEVVRYPVAKRVTVGIAEPVVTAPPQPASPSGGQGSQAPSQPPSVAPQPSGGQFIRPVPVGIGRVTVGLWGYRGHTGVDIAVREGTGTPILAAASGTVVRATHSNVGYGNHIIIDHGNGYQTYYAHNSALYVSVGQYVQQGQVIAGMGRTGNSTGVHLHFEIRLNGRIMNPADYIRNL
ncbi:MAG: peptidoglycan DD-metalloendopeptidase family protein [Oscillospiraceae bacterium]|nr:peptidoglycan DD-metalloendopeptidase family protein [Oscillospiraceae bacterium]